MYIAVVVRYAAGLAGRAQKDYERLMSESQKTRAQNVESITAKEAAKADLDAQALAARRGNFLFSSE